MKIALVCPYNMFERSGGVQQVVEHLHDGLTKKGHGVKIITPRPPGYKGEAPADYIILGNTTNFTAGFGAAGNWGLPADSKEIADVLEREKFDVINFHEPWAPLLAWQMLKQSKAAHVGTFHANLADRPSTSTWVNVFIPYARNLAQKLQVITAVSNAPVLAMHQAAKSEGERKMIDSIKYIPNGIDLNLYKPPKKRLPLNGPNTKTALYVGRLDRRKNVEALIKAFAIVEAKMPHAYLIIAGQGTRRSGLEEQAKALGIRNIHFTGYVDEEEKKRLMGHADVFCVPAMYGESFGIVLTEAMAMGTPVLGGRNNGYINVLTGVGRIGLVDAKATEDLAERLMVVMTEDKLANMMRAWGLREVKKYDYTKIINDYEAAYKEAVRLANNGKNGQTKQQKAAVKKGPVYRLFVRRHVG